MCGSWYDTVLIDTPPLLPVTDAAAIAPAADGVLLVTRFRKTTRDQVAAAVAAISAVSVPLLGTVLNMVPRRGPRAYARYHTYYASHPSPKQAPAATAPRAAPRQAVRPYSQRPAHRGARQARAAARQRGAALAGPAGRAVIVLDVAGGEEGGMPASAASTTGYLRRSPGAPTCASSDGGSACTPAWLARRELAALGGERKVALNNAAFVGPGGARVTVMQNALHYLTEAESRELAAEIPRSMHAQAAVVRRCARRSDVLVTPVLGDGRAGGRRVPRAARPGRWCGSIPSRPTCSRPRERAPAILCPIVFQPYKRMAERLRELVAVPRSLTPRSRCGSPQRPPS